MLQRIKFHLSQALASFLLRDVSLCDVLLERREQRPEQLVVIPEEAGLRNAAWIQR